MRENTKIGKQGGNCGLNSPRILVFTFKPYMTQGELLGYKLLL